MEAPRLRPNTLLRAGAKLTAVLWAFGAACASDNDADPGMDFSFAASDCKKEGYAAMVKPPTAGAAYQTTLPTVEDLGIGLQCVRWHQTGSGRIAIDLYNFDGACGASYDGRPSVGDDGTLELTLVNAGCMVAGCGSCIYDWSFEIDGLDMTRDLPIEIALDTCPGQGEPERETTMVPLASQPEGIQCRYASAGALSWVGRCGALHMPCDAVGMCSGPGGSAGSSGAPLCEGDLVCATAPGTSEICQQPCTTTADCDVPLLTCEGGLCQLTEGW